MPGKVKVKIISGRNLPVMDRSSDTTDAYVEIKLATTTYKTDVCRKSLHPQWNSDWYRFEVDDSELQDEPLQIRLMDHDTYSANDAIGKVYIDLNPLLLPASSLLLKWNGEHTNSHENTTNAVMSGWVPVYDTMHGIRGEVNIIVKVELFSDFNKFRASSCGVQFFCSPVIPHGFYAQVIHGFVEELVVNDDPEYQWIDKIRTPRASNEARQTLFFKLSGELQRRIGLKALDLGANAVIGYCQSFDLEGESGIVARGIGTAVTLVKLFDVPGPAPMDSAAEERAQNYLKFLCSDKGFRLNSEPEHFYTNKSYYYPQPYSSISSLIPVQLAPRTSNTSAEMPDLSKPPPPSILKPSNRAIKLHHSTSLQTLLKQEDMRRPVSSGFTQRFKNLKYSSQSALSKTMTAIKAKFSDNDLSEEQDEDQNSINISKAHIFKHPKFMRAISDSSLMAEILVRSTMQADYNLDKILESQDGSPDKPKVLIHQTISSDDQSLGQDETEDKHLESYLSLPDDYLDLSSNASSATESDSSDEASDNKDSNVVLDTVSDIVKNVEEIQHKMHLQEMQRRVSQEQAALRNTKEFQNIDRSAFFAQEKHPVKRALNTSEDEMILALSDEDVEDIVPLETLAVPEKHDPFTEAIKFRADPDNPASILGDHKQRNPFNFGDFAKSNVFSIDSTYAVPSTSVSSPTSMDSAFFSDRSEEHAKHSFLRKIHVLANTALHNVLMEKIRDSLHHHHDIKKEIADKTRKRRNSLHGDSVLGAPFLSMRDYEHIPNSPTLEKDRSYLEFMDLHVHSENERVSKHLEHVFARKTKNKREITKIDVRQDEFDVEDLLQVPLIRRNSIHNLSSNYIKDSVLGAPFQAVNKIEYSGLKRRSYVNIMDLHTDVKLTERRYQNFENMIDIHTQNMCENNLKTFLALAKSSNVLHQDCEDEQTLFHQDTSQSSKGTQNLSDNNYKHCKCIITTEEKSRAKEKGEVDKQNLREDSSFIDSSDKSNTCLEPTKNSSEKHESKCKVPVDQEIKKPVVKTRDSLLQIALGNLVSETVQEMMVTSKMDCNSKDYSQEYDDEVFEESEIDMKCEQNSLIVEEKSDLNNSLKGSLIDKEKSMSLAGDSKILTNGENSKTSQEIHTKFLPKVETAKKICGGFAGSDTTMFPISSKICQTKQPTLLQVALGNVVSETVQDIMATSHIEDSNKASESFISNVEHNSNSLVCDRKSDCSSNELKTNNAADKNKNQSSDVALEHVTLTENPKSFIMNSDNISLESGLDINSETPHGLSIALNNVLLETFQEVCTATETDALKDDFRKSQPSTSIDPQTKHESKSHDVTHTKIYHALVDKFKGIISNVGSGHGHGDGKKKGDVKHHSLLQTALENILMETVNDTMITSNQISDKVDVDKSKVEGSSIDEKGIKHKIDEKHHGKVHKVLHNVLADKIHAFTHLNFMAHKKHKKDGSECQNKVESGSSLKKPDAVQEAVMIMENSTINSSNFVPNKPESDTTNIMEPVEYHPSAPLNPNESNIKGSSNLSNIACSNLEAQPDYSQPINTEIENGSSNIINTSHARFNPFHRNVGSPQQETIKVEYGHQRCESMGAKMSQSPAKVFAIPNIHRRSSDSDLSITPKGNSFTGSDRSVGCMANHFMRNNMLRTTVHQENFNILEYPFLTMARYPPGFITYLGGSVSARSVKLLERITNPEEPESRDIWWSEIRMEIRSHARSLNCNAVLGYIESTSICDDVCVLSASGTAAIIGYHGEMNDNVGPLPFIPKQQPTKEPSTVEQTDSEKEKTAKPTENLTGSNKSGSPEPDTFPITTSNCTICHLPYNTNSLPMRTNSSKCSQCKQAKVPDILLATIEIPENTPIIGRGCFIQSYVCRPLKDLKGESNAKEISDGLPFLEYELHRLLVNKLKVKGMNAIFGVKVRISIGERTLIGTATGSAVFLSPLPSPTLPKLVSDRDTDEKKIALLQKSLHDIVKKNIEIYRIKNNDMNIQTGRILSDAEDSEDEQAVLDVSVGNKDCCVLEVDDPEDREVLNLLMEPRPPDGFHVVNTEQVPGLDDLEIVKNLQMFTQIWRAKIAPPYNLDKHFHKLLETVYFKLRRMIPCALCDLQFRVESPEPDEIQLCVLGMALGLGDPMKNNKFKRKNPLVKKNEDELIFSLEEDNIPENSVPQTQTSSNYLCTQSIKYRPKSPSKSKLSTKQRHVPYRERHGVDITPLSYVPGGKIEKYLGNLNFFFIRETTSIREEGGLSGFLHSFVTEVLAIVRAHVTALGGNAMVAYFMNECVLNHNLHKNQGQCLINVGGDVVFVTYYSEDQ